MARHLAHITMHIIALVAFVDVYVRVDCVFTSPCLAGVAMEVFLAYTLGAFSVSVGVHFRWWWKLGLNGCW
ncbi:hypothetical protein EV426DRAFT_594969 [Tirmania nivea]|nr:hypothetical protein EV426DRAFT_594969 [Tirmania nivea]